MSEAKKTEADICESFIAKLRLNSFRVYPEFLGFDFYAVDKFGYHYGFEAKRTPNIKVLSQIVSKQACQVGPDYFCVLTGGCGDLGFHRICEALSVIYVIPSSDVRMMQQSDFPPFCNVKPILPVAEEFTAAGTASPIKLTSFKIKAMAILAILEVRGYVTADDFKRTGIARTSVWTNKHHGWLVQNPLKPGTFVTRPGTHACHSLKLSHPENWNRILDRTKKEVGDVRF